MQNFKTLNNNYLFIGDKRIVNGSLGYNFSIPIKLFFANITFNYMRAASNNLNEIDFGANLVKTSTILFNNHTNSIFLLGGISKYIFKLRTAVALRINIQQSNFNQLQSKSFFTFNNQSLSADFTISSKLTQKISSNYSASFLNSVSKNIVENQNRKALPKQYFEQLQQQLSLNINFSNFFYLKFKSEHLFIKQQNYHNYFFNDIYFFYNLPKKRINFILSFNNMFNTQSFITNNVDAFLYNQNLFFVRPRQVLITTSFAF